MATLKETQQDLDLVSSIKNITSIYQDLATMRMRQIQEEVLKTRTFLEGVAEIYNHAKSAYLASLGRLGRKAPPEKLKEISFIRRNGKTIVVFLSANERFYGTLILDTWQEVLDYLSQTEAELAVVGEVGKHLAQAQELTRRVNYFDLDDQNPGRDQIKVILDFINNYEKIIVFHGRFESVFHQKPVQTDVSGGVALEETSEKAKSYLFEPSPKEILKFFETEIIEALFNHTILEHQLARSASRMVAMDRATQNAEKRIKKLDRKLNRLSRRIQNKKLLETIIRSKFS